MRGAHWLAVAALLGAADTPARLIENWSYDRQFKAADLVVIARAEGEAATDDPPPFAYRPGRTRRYSTSNSGRTSSSRTGRC